MTLTMNSNKKSFAKTKIQCFYLWSTIFISAYLQ